MKTLFTLLGMSFLLVNGAMAEETAAQKEWHEYCEMTIHTTVDGWVVDQSEQEVSLPISENNLKCAVEVHHGSRKTSTWTKVSLSEQTVQPFSQLHLGDAMVTFYEDGEISEAVACARVKAVLEEAKSNGGVLKAKLKRQLVRQDWTTSKNTDVKILDTLHFTFGKEPGLQLRADGSTSAQGKYCAHKPE